MTEQISKKKKKQLSTTEFLAGDSVPIPVVSKTELLPFNSLSWKSFERLCLRLVMNDPDRSGTPYLYGVEGDDQEGIDIVSKKFAKDGKIETWCYQCKKYDKFSLADLKAAIEALEYRADRYIIVLSCEAGKKLRDYVRDCKEKTVELWDNEQLSSKLKEYPEIVEDVFGEDWATAFCGNRYKRKVKLEVKAERTLEIYQHKCLEAEKHARLDQGEDSLKLVELGQIYVNPKLKLNNTADLDLAKSLLSRFLGINRNGNPTLQNYCQSDFDGVRFVTEELEHLAKPNHISKLLIRGVAGFGKSTFTQFLAQLYRAKWLGEENSNQPSFPLKGRIVFRVILRDYAAHISKDKNDATPPLLLETYLAQQIRKMAAPQTFDDTDIATILECYPTLVMLDGWDELASQDLQQKVLDQIKSFLNTASFAKANMIVIATSRPAVYTEPPQLEGFLPCDLQPFDEKQTLEYAQSWLNLKATQLQPERAKEILDTLKSSFRNTNNNLPLLLTNPLQVTIILLLLEQNRKLPSAKEGLFDAYWEYIAKREEVKLKDSIWFDKSVLFELHSALGYALHSRAASGLVQSSMSKAEFEQLIRNFLQKPAIRERVRSMLPDEIETQIRILLEAVSDRLVLITQPTDEDMVGFEQRSFQEFFAAAYLVDTASSFEERFKWIRERVGQEHWQNVNLLLVERVARTRQAEIANLLSEVCEPLDRESDFPLAKRGAWFALEILADGAVNPSSNLGSVLLRYGLSIFDTGITKEDGYSFRNNFLERIIQQSNYDYVSQALAEKAHLLVRFQFWGNLQQLLRLARRSGGRTYISQYEYEELIDLLLTVTDNSTLVWELLSEDDVRYEQEWLFELCQRHNKGWYNRLYYWWFFSRGYLGRELLEHIELNETVASEIIEAILEYDHTHGDGPKDLDDYIIPAKLSYHSQILMLMNTKMVTDKWSESIRGVEIKIGDIGLVYLQRPSLEDDEGSPYWYSTEDYDLDLEDWNTLLNRSDLLANLQLLLWVLYWSENEPTSERVKAFLDYLEKLQNTGAISASFWYRYWMCKWPLLDLAIKLQMAYGRPAIEQLEAYLDSPAHDEIAQKIIVAFENMTQQLFPSDATEQTQTTTFIEMQVGLKFATLLPDLQSTALAMGLVADDLVTAHIGNYGFHLMPNLQPFAFDASQLEAWFQLALQQVNRVERLEALVRFLAANKWPNVTVATVQYGQKLIEQLLQAWQQQLNGFATTSNYWLFNIDYLDVILVIASKLAVSANNYQLLEGFIPQILKLVDASPQWGLENYTIKTIAGLPSELLSNIKGFASSEDKTLKLGATKLWRKIVRLFLFYRKYRGHFYDMALEENQQILGSREDAENGLALILTTADFSSALYLGGVALLIWSDFPFEESELTARLETAMQKAKDASSSDIAALWRDFIAEVPVSTNKIAHWKAFLTKILETPENYPNSVSAVAMERYLQLVN